MRVPREVGARLPVCSGRLMATAMPATLLPSSGPSLLLHGAPVSLRGGGQMVVRTWNLACHLGDSFKLALGAFKYNGEVCLNEFRAG